LSEITEILDRNKSQRSVRANFIHSCDAHIVREVINSEKIDQTIPIHDCFIIDQFNTSTLIEEVNRAMSIKNDIIIKKEEKEIYSIFILI